MNINIRQGTAGDHNFILSSWLQSYREYCPRPVPSGRVYYREHQEQIKSLLDHSKILVACTEDQDQIVGYVIAVGDTIHYIYVKAVFRKFGVANRLLDECKATQFSQFTKFTPFFERRGLQFNPYEFYKDAE